MKTTIVHAAFAVMCVFSGHLTGQNLIQNGTFSVNAMNNCVGNVASWVTSPDMQLSDCCDTNLPGNWWLDITGCGYGNGRWAQQSVPTTVGSTYLLQWQLGCYANVPEMTDAGANVEINGQFVGLFSHADFSGSELAYHTFNYCFVATQPTTTVKFIANGSATSLTPSSYSPTPPNVGVNYPYTGRIALDNVSILLVAPVTASVKTGSTICKGANSTLTVTGAVTYTWLPSNASSSSLVVTPSVSTCYTVKGIHSNSCTTNATVCVIVATCQGMPDLAGQFALSIHPNPAQGNVILEYHDDGNVSYRLIDLVGRQLLQGEFRRSHALDLSEFSSGTYIIICTAGETTVSRRLIIE
jgi:hypothetical protein